eukprot:TRINITY_DN31682_c0_g1_i4.p1 TRINITY_DN31682_c0_g1~~TRINITY_DN31682_c0_g1_i4.p1  ORF type:complete len:776 (-),score=122.91 TRINITY_DN31682_c0_g1_i4:33-2360(-)
MTAAVREDDLRRLLCEFLEAENTFLKATCGRAHSLGNFVLSQPWLQRRVIPYLAAKHFPLKLMLGKPGIGKSALLRALAARVRHMFPALKIYLLEDGNPLTLLRRLQKDLQLERQGTGDLHGDDGRDAMKLSDDKLTDQELLMMPLVEQAAREGGVVFLIDGLRDWTAGFSTWLPTPLPPGARCVVVANEPQKCRLLNEQCASGAQMKATEYVCQPLPAKEAADLAFKVGLNGPTMQLAAQKSGNPLWIHLAAKLTADVEDPLDLGDNIDELVQRFLEKLSETVGQQALDDFLGPLVHSRQGMLETDLKELWTQQRRASDDFAFLLRELVPFFFTSGASQRAGESPLEVAWAWRELLQKRFAAEESRAWHRRLAAFFTKQSDSLQRAEAIHHMAALQDTEACLRAIADCDVFTHLFTNRYGDLVEYCKSMGGYLAVRQALLTLPLGGTDQQSIERGLMIGSFLSQVGEFAAAQQVLKDSKPQAHAACDEWRRLYGRLSSAIAENEVRYWDSRRDWGSVANLERLMVSSQDAVRYLQPYQKRPRELLELAVAYTKRANACFKAACVCQGEEATSYLNEADSCIQQVRKLLAHCPAHKVYGRALLVGGVTNKVRAHKLEAELEADSESIHSNSERARRVRQVLRTAASQFIEAEKILVTACGEVNEGSIYTHGNLAEFYLQDVRCLELGLRHFAEGCCVGVKLLGPEHPNVRRKLQELGHLLSLLDTILNVEDRERLLQGDLLTLVRLLESIRRHCPEVDLDTWVDDPRILRRQRSA